MFSFGQQPQPQQQQQQQRQTSAFGSTPAAGTTPAFGFGAANFAAGQQPGGGVFGGFGAQQPTTSAASTTGFGGFGSAAQQPGGTSSGGLFGQPPSGGGAAATVTGQSTPAGFGGGFAGQSTMTPFGAQPAAAAPTSTGFGGFGTQQPTTASAFGGGFGGTSAFGAATNLAANPATSSVFGGFGTGGGNNATSTTVNNGTVLPKFQSLNEKDPINPLVSQVYHSISAMAEYKGWSFEELRVKDYEQNRKYPAATASGGAFGSAFGQQPASSGAFGGAGLGGGAFGSATTAQPSLMFGAQQQQQQPTTTAFGAAPSTAATATGATINAGGLFGATQQPATSGFGGGAFGQQQPASSAFGFGQTNTTNAFGATAQPAAGLFGQTQPTTAAFTGFGQQQQQKPATGFGGFGGTPAAGSTGAFGANNTAAPATSSAFGTMATGAFGSGGTTAPATSAFGAQQSAKPAFGFGAPAGTTTTTTTTTGGFGGGGFGVSTAAKPAFSFGATPAASTAPGGLSFGFGQQQPAAPATAATTATAQPTSSFSFGAPAAGAAPLTTPSMFGQPTTAATTTTAGGGLFGQPTTATTTTTTTTAGGGGGGLFGKTSTTGAPSFSFGTLANGSALGSSSMMGERAAAGPSFSSTGGAFGGLSTALGQSQPPAQPTLVASIDQNAYGANPLLQPKEEFRQSVAAGGAQPQQPLTGQAAAAAAAAMKKSIVIPGYRFFPTPKKDNGVRLKPRLMTPATSMKQLSATQTAAASTTGGAVESAMYSIDAFRTKKSVKKLELEGIHRAEAALNQQPTIPTGQSSLKTVMSNGGAVQNESSQSDKVVEAAGGGSVKKVTWQRLSDTAASPDERQQHVSTAASMMPTPVKRLDFTSAASPEPQLASRTPQQPQQQLLSAGSSPASRTVGATTPPIKLYPSISGVSVESEMPLSRAAPDYYTVPSLEKLSSKTREQLTSVDGFEVVRKQFGKVKWLQPVDLSLFYHAKEKHGFSNLDVIPGGVVQILHKLCCVYESVGIDPSIYDNVKGLISVSENEREPLLKHPRGSGLNLPAQISLERCWPVDKMTRSPIKDPDHPRVKAVIEKLKRVDGTAFVSYEANTGMWTFTVDHFSRYGFVDDDDDDENDNNNENDNENDNDNNYQAEAMVATSADSSSFPNHEAIVAFESRNPCKEQWEDASEAVDDENRRVNSAAKTHVTASRTAPRLASQLGLDRRRISKMRSAMYSGDREAEGKTERKQTPHKPEYGGSGSIRVRRRQTPQAANKDEQLMQDLAALADSFTTDRSPVLTHKPSAKLQQVTTDSNTLSNAHHTVKGLSTGQSSDHSINHAVDREALDYSYRPIFNNKSDVSCAEFIQKESVKLPVVLSGPLLRCGKQFKSDVPTVRDQEFFLKRSQRVSFCWLPGAQHILIRPNVDRSLIRLELIRPGPVVSSDTTQKSFFGTVHLLQTQLAGSLVDLSKGIPRITLSSETPFSSFRACLQSLLSKHAVTMSNVVERLLRSELTVWELCAALFDHLHVLDADGEDTATDEASAVDYRREQIRKDLFGRWLKQAVKPAVDRDLPDQTTDGSRILTLLSGRRIKEAVGLALKARDFYLATILSQISDCGGANSLYAGGGGLDDQARDDIYSQIKSWRTRLPENIPADLLLVYQLLCSDLDSIHASRRFDWKRTLALYFWYWSMGNSRLSDSIEAFDYAFMNAAQMGFENNVSRPLPWYLEGMQSATDRGQPLDILYHLLKIYCKPDYSLESTLAYKTFYPHRSGGEYGLLPSVRLPWLMWRMMKARGVRDFSAGEQKNTVASDEMILDESGIFGKDLVGESSFAVADGAAEPIHEPSQIGSRLIADFAFELEQQGLWTWAVFVVLHDHGWRGREILAKQIIQRHCIYDWSSDRHFVEFGWSTESLRHLRVAQTAQFKKSPDYDSVASAEKDERFLVQKLKIPSSWVSESKALYARSVGDHLSEFQFLLEAGSQELAHNVLYINLLPRALCLQLYETIEMLCGTVDRSLVSNWHVGAGFYLDFLAARRQPERLELAINVMKAARGYQLKLQRGDIDQKLNNLQFRQVLNQITNEMAMLMMKSSQIMSDKVITPSQDLRDLLLDMAPQCGTAQMILTQKLAVGYFSRK